MGRESEQGVKNMRREMREKERGLFYKQDKGGEDGQRKERSWEWECEEQEVSEVKGDREK